MSNWTSRPKVRNCGGMAQSVEHIVHIDGVVGSSPTVTTTAQPLKIEGTEKGALFSQKGTSFFCSTGKSGKSFSVSFYFPHENKTTPIIRRVWKPQSSSYSPQPPLNRLVIAWQLSLRNPLFGIHGLFSSRRSSLRPCVGLQVFC